MKLPSETELDLVNALFEKFEEFELDTKIIIYDHNWDNLDYARGILNTDSREKVDGTAFHCYAGDYKAPGQLSNEFPDKSIHFTECTGGEWGGEWAPTTLKWNQGRRKYSRARIQRFQLGKSE